MGFSFQINRNTDSRHNLFTQGNTAGNKHLKPAFPQMRQHPILLLPEKSRGMGREIASEINYYLGGSNPLTIVL